MWSFPCPETTSLSVGDVAGRVPLCASCLNMGPVFFAVHKIATMECDVLCHHKDTNLAYKCVTG